MSKAFDAALRACIVFCIFPIKFVLKKPMRVALVCPGQGAQKVGMGRLFPEEGQAVFQEMNRHLGRDLSAIFLAGPQMLLDQTMNTQPAMLAVSVAAFRVLETLAPNLLEKVACVAGHSAGEIAALHVAGALSLEGAAKLSAARASAMENACPHGLGGMGVVLGLSLEHLQTLVDEISTPDAFVAVANDNGSGQWVVSGHAASVKAVLTRAKALGGRTRALAVGGPFHTPLMKPAQDSFQPFLNQTVFTDARVPVLTNVSAQPQTHADVLQAHLMEQMVTGVRWRETMHKMEEVGVTHVVELSPC